MERLLHRIKCFSFGQTFDRHHFRAVFHNGESQTGVDTFAIHQAWAGAALSVVASLFCSG